MKLSVFLFGKNGLIFGVMTTLDEIILPSVLFKAPKLILTWYFALKDELREIPLDKDSLENVRIRFLNRKK